MSLTFASPIAAPEPCVSLVTSADTVSTGRSGRFLTLIFRCTLCRVCVVFADSFTICAPSGNWPVGAGPAVVAESSFVQPDTRAAQTAAAATTEVMPERRAKRRREVGFGAMSIKFHPLEMVVYRYRGSRRPSSRAPPTAILPEEFELRTLCAH